MSTVTSPDTGRLIILTNLTNHTLGVAATTLGPYGTRNISLRKIQGHPSYMEALRSLVAAKQLKVMSITQEVLTEDEVGKLDAPLSADIYLVRDVFTTPIVADVDAIMTAFAAPAVETQYSGADLDGVLGAGVFTYPRNLTFKGTTGLGEALLSKDVVIQGLDVYGQIQTETLTLSAIGASTTVTDAGLYAFTKILSLTFDADAGVVGDYEVGFGVKFGLSRPLVQGGLIFEALDNAAPGAAATVAFSAVGLPNGTVTFNAAPNGARTYIVDYIPG